MFIMTEAHRVSPELSHDLARTDPERFRDRAIGRMAERSKYGLQIMGVTMRGGAVRPENIQVDPSSWASFSNGLGILRLGAAPMPPDMKDRMIFHAERFSYADEVAYKLLHEFLHSYVYLNQHDSANTRLNTAISSIREASDGARGITGVGSHPHYQGKKAKVIEDLTEIQTMYAWDPNYAREFVDFLADPTFESERNRIGLQGVGSPDVLFGLIEDAVLEGLPAAA
jgi:hypothetical protein